MPPKPVFINWRTECYIYYYNDLGQQVKAHVGGVLLVPQGQHVYARALIQNQGDPGWVTFRVIDRKTKIEIAKTEMYMNYLDEWVARLDLGTFEENIFAYPDVEIRLETMANDEVVDYAEFGIETKSWADIIEQIPRAGYLGIPWWVWATIAITGTAIVISAIRR